MKKTNLFKKERAEIMTNLVRADGQSPVDDIDSVFTDVAGVSAATDNYWETKNSDGTNREGVAGYFEREAEVKIEQREQQTKQAGSSLFNRFNGNSNESNGFYDTLKKLGSAGQQNEHDGFGS
jgi:uncharacterized protein YoxC